ncbi:hypothetical protein H6G89_04585 [Oscillatoria sp. FACHB-1407]|uniref:hypothetical protein n=1 Tax=Oscillatoria sp. FACHB-1407 TaxID=2692847 RepID=UPI001684B229|nr:hypothetical protein [Oscillatoria sp. FACHB-1407]MBD2460314.1 hypothetical protein [Oscillatoria sp. FACHB-1407]
MAHLKELTSLNSGIGFWLQWMCVTICGFLLSLYWIEVGFRPDIRWFQGVMGGLIIGTAQWLVLRQRLPQAVWWIAATTLAWGLIGYSKLGALGWVVPQEMYSVTLRSLYGGLDGLKVGAILGAIQWFALRRHVSNSAWWIAVSAIAWALGLAIGWSSGAILRLKTGIFLGEVGGLGLGWGAIAAITGICLIPLLSLYPPKSLKTGGL